VTAAVELVARLRARGVALEPEGTALVIRPASAVRPDEVEALRHLKAEIMTLLTAPAMSATPAPRPSFWPASLPSLGLRRMIAFTNCQDCEGDPPHDEVMTVGAYRIAVPGQRGTFAAYGSRPLCARHARARTDDDLR
jgi:hypothetical protein